MQSIKKEFEKTGYQVKSFHSGLLLIMAFLKKEEDYFL